MIKNIVRTYDKVNNKIQSVVLGVPINMIEDAVASSRQVIKAVFEYGMYDVRTSRVYSMHQDIANDLFVAIGEAMERRVIKLQQIVRIVRY